MTPRVIDAAELPDLARRALRDGRGDEEIAALQEGLVTLGRWPADRNWLESWAQVAGEEVAGLYVARERTLFVVRDPRLPASMRVASWLLRRDLAHELVISHELLHALQHVHFPALFDAVDALQAHDDVVSAIHAALEGDATLYAFLAAQLPPPAPSELAASIERDADSRDDGLLASMPLLLRRMLTSPYVRGYPLAFREASQLLADPPVSSEQLLHPGRRHEPFEIVDLTPARDQLPAHCRLVDENTVGEIGIAILVDELAPAGLDAAAVAAGWDGDRYLAARCDGRRAFVWLTSWDREVDAVAFERALRGIAPALRTRADLAGELELVRRERSVTLASPDLAPVASALAQHARRARVATFDEVLRFVGVENQGRR